jgi:hypothetical protein
VFVGLGVEFLFGEDKTLWCERDLLAAGAATVDFDVVNRATHL